MKQSEYPPAELRYGENYLAIEECVFYCEDANKGYPCNATVWLRVKSGTFQAYASCDCATQQFYDFVEQLQKMYEFQCFNATLSAMYYGSYVLQMMKNIANNGACPKFTPLSRGIHARR